MGINKLIDKRKSSRRFKDKEVPWKKILDAIDTSSQGPFAGNINNLKFIIVEDYDTKLKIARHANQTWINEASHIIVVTSDNKHLESLYGERGKKYSKQQAGATINTLLLRLTELKIDSCWVGAFADELIQQCLKIPSNMDIEAIIPIGYSKDKHKKPDKSELETKIFWDSWGTQKKPHSFTEASE